MNITVSVQSSSIYDKVADQETVQGRSISQLFDMFQDTMKLERSMSATVDNRQVEWDHVPGVGSHVMFVPGTKERG